MDTLKKYKKHLLALVGAAATGVGLYFLLKDDQEEAPVKKVEKRKPGQPLQKHEKANLLASLISKKHEVKNINTLKAIEEATVKLATPEYYNLVHEYRKVLERRANQNDYKKQVELWENYNKKLGDILDTARREILAMIDIRDSVFEDAKHEFSNDYTDLIISLPFKLLEQIAEPKEITLELYKDIFRFQIELIPNLKPIIDGLSEHLKNPDERQIIIQRIIFDKIFEKFNVEEEQLFTPYIKYGSDPEVIELSNTAAMAILSI